MANATVVIENGVTIGRQYITLYLDGKLAREFLTPRKGNYVKYWTGFGPSTIGKQLFSEGGKAVEWPSDDMTECARFIAKRYRVKFYGYEAR